MTMMTCKCEQKLYVSSYIGSCDHLHKIQDANP